MRVRVGASYRFNPVLFDQIHPPQAQGVNPGDIVTVVNLPGCPRAGVMGMCYIAKDGKFAGQVMTNSLESKREQTQSHPSAPARFH